MIDGTDVFLWQELVGTACNNHAYTFRLLSKLPSDHHYTDQEEFESSACFSKAILLVSRVAQIVSSQRLSCGLKSWGTSSCRPVQPVT